MKKTDTALRVASLLVFLAMAAYLAIYIINRFVDPAQTALVVTATMSDSTVISGLVVRDETVLSSDAAYIDVVAGDGEKLSAGQTAAVVYDTEQALERAGRLADLSAEIEDVTASLRRASGVVSGGVSGSVSGSVSATLTALSSAVRGGDFDDADALENTLAGLVFRAGSSQATEEYLTQLQAEYQALSAETQGDAYEITVQESGIFSSIVDGFEGIGPEYVRTLTPDGLRQVIAADHAVPDDAIGKLATSYNWYYAAIVPAGSAARLSVGDEARVAFGRYYGGELTARVMSVGQPVNGERLVLLRLDRGFLDMLAARAVSAELVYAKYTGLRVPLKGLYRYYAGYMSDADGGGLTAGQAVTLSLGGAQYDAVVSDVGPAQRYGELPTGIEPGSPDDARPSRRLVVFCWPWSDDPVPDTSAGLGKVLTEDGASMTVMNYYEYDPEIDRLCVFTMTAMQAERKKVSLIYAGDEYALVSSSGSDALREGNEVIVRASGLHDGKVFN